MQLQQQYTLIKQDLSSIASKVGELEMEKEEHTLVLNTMKPLAPERKCFRLVGGVLVERQVQDVLPQVSANLDGINQILAQLIETYKKKEKELVDFTTKHQIQVKSQ